MDKGGVPYVVISIAQTRSNAHNVTPEPVRQVLIWAATCQIHGSYFPARRVTRVMITTVEYRSTTIGSSPSQDPEHGGTTH
jgi:hypothetical protein